MLLANLYIYRIRSFNTEQQLSFSPQLTLLVGENNTGKSTIIRTIRDLQSGELTPDDITFNASNASWRCGITNTNKQFFRDKRAEDFSDSIEISCNFARTPNPTRSLSIRFKTGVTTPQLNNFGIPLFHDIEPNNWIFSHLSGRRTNQYTEQVSSDNTNALPGTHANLPQKISRMNSPQYPGSGEFQEVCNSIIGFTPGTLPSRNGVQAGLVLGRNAIVPMTNMGSGIPQIAALIADLCVGNGNLYLIEEPESDLHPRALKKLLGYLIEKSKNNQVIISTHSHIVTNVLGRNSTTAIYLVRHNNGSNRIKFSTIQDRSGDPEKRHVMLDEIGYELGDMNLWDAWLFLEESTTERFINDFFIPWYTPNLAHRLRTFSANGISQVANKFTVFASAITFFNLQRPVYKDRAWVMVDDGDDGRECVRRLHECFPSWSEDRFRVLDASDFERYYPPQFITEVDNVLALQGQEKRAGKNLLREQVIQWIKDNPKQALDAFSASAAPIIGVLKDIDTSLSALS